MKVNAEDQLRKTDRQLKSIQYQLGTIISNGECHIELQGQTTTTSDIIENTPIYFKLDCKEQLVPCTIKIRYKTQGDLKIYVSTTNNMPSPSDNM